MSDYNTDTNTDIYNQAVEYLKTHPEEIKRLWADLKSIEDLASALHDISAPEYIFLLIIEYDNDKIEFFFNHFPTKDDVVKIFNDWSENDFFWKDLAEEIQKIDKWPSTSDNDGNRFSVPNCWWIDIEKVMLY